MRAGDVVLHRNFIFHDGGMADKYLVVLGSVDGVVLVAKTTSQGKRYRNDHGCQPGNYFPAFLLTAGCCFLPKSTWICLSEFYELSPQRLQERMVAGEVFKAGELSAELTRGAQLCALDCFDLTRAQEAFVRASMP